MDDEVYFDLVASARVTMRNTGHPAVSMNDHMFRRSHKQFRFTTEFVRGAVNYARTNGSIAQGLRLISDPTGMSENILVFAVDQTTLTAFITKMVEGISQHDGCRIIPLDDE
jgi:hypothetical protein